MFLQVIKGKTSDPAGVRRVLDEWLAKVRPGAIGFLGTTYGITEDGTLVALARFEDEGAAAANSARPEQGAWWEGMAALLQDVTFRDSSEVQTALDGPSTEARFVQVIEGTVKDKQAAEAFETDEMLAELKASRPEILGMVRAWLPGDEFVQAVYFAGEEAARQGEASEEFSEPQQEFASLFGDMTFIDLRDPQHA